MGIHFRSLILYVIIICLIPLNAVYADTTYVVQRGDTLYKISRRYNISVEMIKNTNNLRSDVIYIGQQLNIPTTNSGAPTTASVTTAPSSTSYIVQAGDTLYRISRRYGVDVNSLRSANRIFNDTIYIGQALVIPSSSATTTSTQTIIRNISGRNQALPLDCEARSAVDWANYFGTSIDELEFFKRLPVSDDPDVGFVGNVNGIWGQTPPNAYGVHAEPIAALLRQYKINAVAKRNMTLDELRAEINAARPVIIWVTGHVSAGNSFNYTSANKHTTLVAPYEHTVIVIGYSETTFTFLDGANVYTRPIATFQSAWSPLGNMAVVKQ